MNLNKVLIAGNLTRDVEVKFFANDRAVANFGLAVNRRYKGSDGEQKEETTFIDIEAWGRTAELCGQYLTKGRQCFIEGRLKLDAWEDKQTSQKRSKLKVVADNVQFIGGNSGKADRANAGHGPSEPAQEPQAGGGYDDSDPPFLPMEDRI